MQRIRFETAKLLKEKTSDFKDYEGDFYEDEHEEFPAPYQEEVIDWLWEHKINVTPILIRSNFRIRFVILTYLIQYYEKGELVTKDGSKPFKTRNDAIEEGIIRALELIK